MRETDLRDQICDLARSMFDRGLTYGSIGNIAARTVDGGLLVSPTGTSFGRGDPARLALILCGTDARMRDAKQLRAVITTFDVEWDG